ncbi:MAG: hypothetical protein JW969_10945 [Spirochaetales bacterium]|nr:hypothetical protein [Spirochaetales bacterium]
MVNKRFLIMVLVALLTLSAFGEGQSEKDFRGKRPVFGDFENKSKTTLSGEVYFDNKLFPELKTQGKTVKLILPRRLLSSIEIAEGTPVNAEGYLLKQGEDRLPPNSTGDFLFLTKATVNGKEYDIEKLRDEWGPRNGRGMHKGRKGGDGFCPGPYDGDD